MGPSYLRDTLFWNSHGDYNYYDRDKTHKNIGYDEYFGNGNGLENIYHTGWFSTDQELMEATLPLYLDAEHFSTYYMTLSGHAPYGPDHMFIDMYKDRVAQSDYANASPAIQSFVCKNLVLEDAMAYLINALEEAGIADRTVIAMMNDHYPYGLDEGETWGNTEDFVSELKGVSKNYSRFERDENTFFIWSGALEKMDPITVEGPASSLDMLPTLLNLFSMDYDFRLFAGRDILSDSEAIVVYRDFSWMGNKASYDAADFRYQIKDEADPPDEAYRKRMDAEANNQLVLSSFILSENYYQHLEELGLLPPVEELFQDRAKWKQNHE